MIPPNLSYKEKTCIRVLATLLNDGRGRIDKAEEDQMRQALTCDSDQEYHSIWRMMKHIGVQEFVETNPPGHGYFRITPLAIQMARELDFLDKQEKEPRDIVSKANESVRRHWLLALAVIAFFVLTAAVTAANQLIQLFQNLGWMTKP